MTDLIKPVEFKLKDSDGKEHTYILSNFDSIMGRKIIALYPTSALPKIGDYQVNHDTMLLLMSFVAVPTAGQPLRLSTEALIRNHVPEAEMLLKIELAIMEKNFSFFQDGRGLDFFDRLVQIVLKKTLEMLTPLSEGSLPTVKPPSMN